MSIESYTQFWADKFQQHFHFGIDLAIKNADKLVAHDIDVDQLVRDALKFQRTWQRIRDVPYTLMERPAIIPRSLSFKKLLESLFKVAGVPCAPALFHHMQEELLYFRDALLENKWSYAKEVAWWAQEHAENLDFVNCELPQLIKFKKINISKIPSMVKMVFENSQLSNKFKSIASRINEAGDIDEQLYHDMLSAKISHVRGIDKLLAAMPTLPLDDDDKEVVEEMLNHEKEEAVFAFGRIEI